MLIKYFGSVKKISNATIEELNKILPLKTEKNLKRYLENYKNNNS